MMRRIFSQRQRRRMPETGEARSSNRFTSPSGHSIILRVRSAIYIFYSLWFLSLGIGILDIGLVIIALIKTLASGKLPFAWRSSRTSATCQQQIIMRAPLSSQASNGTISTHWNHVAMILELIIHHL